MDAKKGDSGVDPRWRSMALVLGVACALLATVVVVLLLGPRPSSPAPPPGPSTVRPIASLPDAPEASTTHPSPDANRSEIVVDSEMVRIEDHFTLEVETVVYRAARRDAEVVARLAPGTAVDAVGRRGEWTLLARHRGGEAAWIGWVLLPGTVATPAAETPVAPGKWGTATLEGTVSLSGQPPEMKVPLKRKDADVCKATDVKYNAVLVRGGKLQDVLVRIAPRSVPGRWTAPTKAAEVDQIDCMYVPRIQGVVAGQSIEIHNGDATLHNVHSYNGTETLFNQAEPKGAPSISKQAPDEPAFLKLTCDVHSWMRSFVVVTDHPFFAVTGEDGTFKIERVPPGKYALEAWHSQYGLLRKEGIVVGDGGDVTADFRYTGREEEPPENKGELSSLF